MFIKSALLFIYNQKNKNQNLYKVKLTKHLFFIKRFNFPVQLYIQKRFALLDRTTFPKFKSHFRLLKHFSSTKQNKKKPFYLFRRTKFLLLRFRDVNTVGFRRGFVRARKLLCKSI